MCRPVSRLVGLLPWVLLGLVLPRPARLAAHSFQPAVLLLREAPSGRVEVRLTLPPDAEREDGTSSLVPGLPARCAQVGQGGPRRWELDCGPRGLSGETISILRGPSGPASPADLNRGETLVHVLRRDGGTLSGVVRPGEAGLRVPDAASEAAPVPVRGYFSLGLGHLLGGADHLLFVLSLLLLCATPGGAGALRRLLFTVTAFTLAHSLTLTLAVLGVVRVPAPPAEACIALSLVFSAAALCGGRGLGPPAWMAFGFGLLHGLGFAGVLAETGLPRDRVGPALLLFNLGIEVGQLLFLGLVVGAARLIRRRPLAVLETARRPLAYAVGALGAFFFWQRVASFW